MNKNHYSKDENHILQLLKSEDAVNYDLAFTLCQNIDLSTDFIIHELLVFPYYCVRYNIGIKELEAASSYILLNQDVLNFPFSKLALLPPKIEALDQVKELELECNFLLTIPAEIRGMKQLKYLSVFDNDPGLESISKEIGQLKQLEKLSLGCNNLQSLPDELFDCKQLNHLCLQENPFTQLSEKIGQLQQLELLDLNYAKITQLPQSFVQLKKLKYLLLDCVNIKHQLHLLSELPKLERLSLYGMNLQEFPIAITKIKSLKRLDIGDNPIQFIPKEIENLSNLEQIIIEGLSNQEYDKLNKLLPSVKIYREDTSLSIIYGDLDF